MRHRIVEGIGSRNLVGSERSTQVIGGRKRIMNKRSWRKIESLGEPQGRALDLDSSEVTQAGDRRKKLGTDCIIERQHAVLVEREGLFTAGGRERVIVSPLAMVLLRSSRSSAKAFRYSTPWSRIRWASPALPGRESPSDLRQWSADGN